MLHPLARTVCPHLTSFDFFLQASPVLPPPTSAATLPHRPGVSAVYLAHAALSAFTSLSDQPADAGVDALPAAAGFGLSLIHT